MPAWLIASLPVILATIAGVLTTALLIGPFVLPLYFKHMSRLDRERLLAATKGVYKIVAGVALHTPTNIDDDIAKVLKMVEDELGKSLSEKEAKLVKNAARSMHADPSRPDLSK